MGLPPPYPRLPFSNRERNRATQAVGYSGFFPYMGRLGFVILAMIENRVDYLTKANPTLKSLSNLYKMVQVIYKTQENITSVPKLWTLQD